MKEYAVKMVGEVGRDVIKGNLVVKHGAIRRSRMIVFNDDEGKLIAVYRWVNVVSIRRIDP